MWLLRSSMRNSISTPISLLLILLLRVATAQNQCYYAANTRAGSAIIPCGGSSSISACCQIGDLCLSDSACWNPTHNVTYLYGCTDPTYTDASCPWKCGADFASAPYVGLDYCYNTTQNEWSCTHPPSNSDSIQEFPAQECLDDSIIAFAGPSSLQPVLSLPTDIGGGTVYFSQVNPTSYSLDPNYTPTTTIRATASVPTAVEQVSTTSGTDSSTSSQAPIAGITASSASTTFEPSNTPASTHSTTSISVSTAAASTSASSSPTPSASSGGSGLSTGAKIGIGVGVGLAALGVLAFIGAFFLFRRRRQSHSHQPVSQIDNDYGAGVDTEYKRPRPPSELPGSTKYPDGRGGYTYGPGQGQGGSENGTGTGTNTASWGSAAPTYTQAQHTMGPRPDGADRLHEAP